MIHCLHVPKFPLSQFIEHLWFYEGYHPGHTREKLLPDGAIELIIDMHDTPKRLYDSSDTEKYVNYKGSWISGERKEYIIIEATGSSMMGIRFRPGGAQPFFSFPISELTGRVIQLELIWGNEIREIRERLIAAASVGHKFAILEEFLLTRGKGSFETDKAVDYAIWKIINSPHVITIRELADEIGYSHKHLIDRFDKVVGVTPKLLARIFKFQKVIHMVEHQQTNGGVDWTAIAYDCGYYDQAHFIKEFQAFSGINPTTYLAQRGGIVNYIPLD